MSHLENFSIKAGKPGSVLWRRSVTIRSLLDRRASTVDYIERITAKNIKAEQPKQITGETL